MRDQHRGSSMDGGGGSSGSGSAGRPLKSLLKKPGQPKARKNRVVINEKMNEFFAADYIILIKEECCGDYEEECDCCCQEHEMIRLGNCRECRAELKLGNLMSSSGPDDECGEDDDEDEDEDECDDDEDECDEDEVDEDEQHHQRHQNHHNHQQQQQQQQQQQCDERECRHAALEQHQQQMQQRKLDAERRRQRETLSPPEGYKDLCSAAQAQQELDEGLEDADAVCAECDYYQRQAAVAAEAAAVAAASAAAAAASANCTEDAASGASRQPVGADESKSGHLQDGRRSVATPSALQESEEVAIDQPQPTQPGEVGQRYLVETITMTTVTERRIVREISEEESRPAIDESDSGDSKGQKSIEAAVADGASAKKNGGGPAAEPAAAAGAGASPGGVGKGDEPAEREKPGSELSPLTFKLGGSLVTGNSLKPNSAVRQLFPDPRFISPPPAPSKANSAELEDAALDAALGEPHKFLITADNLRLFDAKRSKLGPASRSDSSESDSSIKRTIERNALRRSLIKYDTGSLRRKNLRSKDLTLEERIRQLTCVDEDEVGSPDNGLLQLEPGATNGYPHSHPANPNANNNNIGGGGGGGPSNGAMLSNGLGGRGAAEGLTDEQLGLAAGQQLPPRTSPSGEERPRGHVIQSHGGHNHHHHHHNSAYKKITELFGPKKSSGSAELSLPDIGLGGKHSMAVKSGGGGGGSKLTSEARRQFLASLAPLSCVAANSADCRDEYYRMPAKPVDRAAALAAYNSDSSYSLEDIEDALNEGIPAPPDVTRGTPTSAGPSLDSFAAGGGGSEPSDELLAFVEQDKSRTERIKKRYSDGCDEQLQQQQQQRRPNNSGGGNSEAIEIPTNHVRLSKDEDNDDDELNDYGFNRRPSVRGIKAQFETTNEIVRQLRSRSAAANSLPEACRLGFQPASSSSSSGHDDELQPGPAAASSSSSDVYRVTYTNEVHADANTITRINNMQKQINDIYQSIAENSVTAALLDQQPRPTGPLGYLDGTLPRTMIPQTDACHRFVDHKNGLINPARMLRIQGPGDGGPGSGPVTPAGVYSTLPKVHRHPQLSAAYSAAAAYSAGVVPAGPAAAAASAAAAAKCYRTMYFVPYNGASDPTYQNIQKALPPHSSPTNYAEHLERYPYPRNGRIDQQQQQQQLQQRYYVRPASVPNTQTSSGALHLHLHQTEELQVSATGPAVPSRAAANLPHPSLVHPMHSQLQQVQQQQQQQQQSASAYSVQTLSGVTYSICPPPPMSQTSATYTYQMQIQGRLSAGDTTSSLQGSLSSVGLASSPTKALIQRSCSVAERGVPEGAASAPSHDFAAMGQPGQGQPPTQSTEPPILDAQNPVYYAMNV